MKIRLELELLNLNLKIQVKFWPDKRWWQLLTWKMVKVYAAGSIYITFLWGMVSFFISFPRRARQKDLALHRGITLL